MRRTLGFSTLAIAGVLLAMPAQASLRSGAASIEPQVGAQVAGYSSYAKCVYGRYHDMAQKFDGQLWGIYFTFTQLAVASSCFEAI